ncbi:MAG: hypothetical protein VX252_14420 [Myxococcota bacterium]|nr:hypothetical protein [Myxococcota bacterium]
MASENEEPKDSPGEVPGIDLPKPTAAPMLVALGITLLFAGLVTNLIVTLVGIPILFSGAIGWWRGVFPHEQHERAPFQPASEGPPVFEPATDKVAHLVAGEDLHRARIPEEIHPYTTGLIGGAIGGVAMALVAMGYGFFAEGSIWYPINLVASSLLPSINQADLAQLTAFNPTAFILALMIHAVLSLLIGLIYASLLPMLPGRPIFWAGIVAPAVWSGLIWLVLGMVAPALDARVDWGWFVASQIAFGLCAGWYVSRSKTVRIMQSWSLVERAGVEASGIPKDQGEDQ